MNHTWRHKSTHQQICSRCGQVRRWLPSGFCAFCVQMSEDIEAVFNNGCPTLTDNWLEELKRHTTVLLVDLPPVPSAPLFGGSYAASMAHEEYAEQKFRFDWFPGLTYRSPLLVKIPDDNERPRRYSGNSHQRRKQRRAQRSHR